MNPSPFRLLLAFLLFAAAFNSAEAVAPKDGRYKGTLTVRTVADGTKTEVKKVFPIAGVLKGGNLVAMMTELPALGSYFTSVVYNMTVGDGEVSMRPNNNAQTLTFGEVKTTTGSMKGTIDLGFVSLPGGSYAEVKRFMALSMTRVGD